MNIVRIEPLGQVDGILDVLGCLRLLSDDKIGENFHVHIFGPAKYLFDPLHGRVLLDDFQHPVVAALHAIVDPVATGLLHHREEVGCHSVDVSSDIPSKPQLAASDLIAKVEDPVFPDCKGVVVNECLMYSEVEAFRYFIGDVPCRPPTKT